MQPRQSYSEGRPSTSPDFCQDASEPQHEPHLRYALPLPLPELRARGPRQGCTVVSPAKNGQGTHGLLPHPSRRPRGAGESWKRAGAPGRDSGADRGGGRAGGGLADRAAEAQPRSSGRREAPGLAGPRRRDPEVRGSPAGQRRPEPVPLTRPVPAATAADRAGHSKWRRRGRSTDTAGGGIQKPACSPRPRRLCRRRVGARPRRVRRERGGDGESAVQHRRWRDRKYRLHYFSWRKHP